MLTGWRGCASSCPTPASASCRSAATTTSWYRRAFSKDRFVRSLQQLVPEIRADDIVRGRSSVRAQAVDHAGRLVDDFQVVAGERTLHVLNASPGATASLEIGQTLARQALELIRP